MWALATAGLWKVATEIVVAGEVAGATFDSFCHLSQPLYRPFQWERTSYIVTG